MADMEYVKYATLSDVERNRPNTNELAFTTKLVKLLLFLLFFISLTIVFRECFLPTSNDGDGSNTIVQERVHIIFLDKSDDKPKHVDPSVPAVTDDESNSNFLKCPCHY